MKNIILLIFLIISITFSSFGINKYNDSLIKAGNAKKSENNHPKRKITEQQTLDSINKLIANFKISDSLKEDSIKKRAIFEKEKNAIKLEDELEQYANRGFTIYDLINYSTLLIILLLIFLFFRNIKKKKNISVKEFFIIWKKNFKELREKEKKEKDKNIKK